LLRLIGEEPPCSQNSPLGLRARCSGHQQERPVFPDVLGFRELDIMRLVLIASLSLGSMVAAHSEPGHTATFCLRSQDAKQVCFVGHQEAVLSPKEFEAQQRVLRAELNEEPLKRAQARRNKAASVGARLLRIKPSPRCPSLARLRHADHSDERRLSGKKREVTLTSPTRLTQFGSRGSHKQGVLSRCTVGVTGLIATRLKPA
jgi:hypothetical protein